MRTLFSSFLLTISLFLSLAPVHIVRADTGSGDAPTETNETCVQYTEADRGNAELAPLVDGVLIDYGIKKGGFTCYVYHLLYQNMVYIIIIAMVLIVFSGVQYMMALGSTDEQAKAKQRVLGILGGVIFYFLIGTVARLLAFNYTL